MLTVLPEKTDKFEKSDTVLVCRDDDKDIGYLAFYKTDYILNIEELSINTGDGEGDDKLGSSYVIYDAMLRSLASYGINHLCYYIESSNNELFSVLKQFGFIENDNKVVANLQQLLKVCKN